MNARSKRPLAVEVLRPESRSDPAPVVAIRGDLDATSRRRLEERLLPYARGGADTVVLDISGVRTVDRPGLAVLVRLDHLLRSAGVGLRLVRPRPQFLDLLSRTGLGRRLTVVLDPADPAPVAPPQRGAGRRPVVTGP